MNSTEARLVAALRSGKYIQTSGSLRFKDRFCCLGVACDLFDCSLWNPDKDDLNQDGCFLYYDFLGTSSLLPNEVRESLGWITDDGMLSFNDRDGFRTNLATLNDHGFTFDQIADLIQGGLVESI